MAMWLNRDTRLSWVYQYRTASDSEWAELVEHIRAIGTNPKQGEVALTITYQAQPPSAVQRRALNDVFKSERGLPGLVAHAFVTDSIPMRGVITALNWFTDKPFREEVFSAPKKALKWLSEVSTHPIDVEGAWNDIVRAVPKEALWVE